MQQNPVTSPIHVDQRLMRELTANDGAANHDVCVAHVNTVRVHTVEVAQHNRPVTCE